MEASKSPGGVLRLFLWASVYGDAEQATRTDEKFFGNARAFNNNYMKAVKRKRLMF